VLERGTFLPREKRIGIQSKSFKDRYHTTEVWYTKQGEKLHPGTGYWVGGNTKVFGGALFRLQERDFEQVKHRRHFSSMAPKYHDFEPYHPGKLYQVHGQRSRSNRTPTTETYSFPPVSHEPRIQEIHDDLQKKACTRFICLSN